jgi:hypothetical protein
VSGPKGPLTRSQSPTGKSSALKGAEDRCPHRFTNEDPCPYAGEPKLSFALSDFRLYYAPRRITGSVRSRQKAAQNSPVARSGDRGAHSRDGRTGPGPVPPPARTAFRVERSLAVHSDASQSKGEPSRIVAPMTVPTGAVARPTVVLPERGRTRVASQRRALEPVLRRARIPGQSRPKPSLPTLQTPEPSDPLPKTAKTCVLAYSYPPQMRPD